MRWRGFNFRRIWIGIAVLALTVGGLVGGSVYAARTGRDAYACLLFNSDQPNALWLYDLQTDRYSYDRRPFEDYPVRFRQGNIVSPDGQRLAYVLPDAIYKTRQRLYLGTPGSNAPGRAIAENIMILGFAWSPDNRSLAYLWHDEAGRAWLTLADADGGNPRTQAIILPRNSGVSLIGWSADGQFIATTNTEAFGDVVSYWSVADLKPISFPLYTYLPYIQHAEWSPTGRQLAYIRTDQALRSRLVVGKFDGDELVEIALDLPSVNNARPVWSPDNRLVALRYNDPNGSHLAVYDVAGDEPEQVLSERLSTQIGWPHEVAWTSDGRSLSYWQPGRGGYPDLVNYSLDRAQKSIVAEDVKLERTDPLSDVRKGWILLVSGGHNARTQVELLPVDGSQRIPVVSDAKLIVGIARSPIDQSILVAWVKDEGSMAPMYLTWAKADGSGKRELLLGTRRIYLGVPANVRWMADGRHIAYRTVEGCVPDAHVCRLGVEVLDLQTMQTQTLAAELDRIEAFELTGDGLIRFLWQQGEQAALDTYRVDGSRVNRYELASKDIEDGEALLSSDGTLAALMVGNRGGGRSLQLARAGGGPAQILHFDSTAVRFGFTPTAWLVWSPDSRLLAFPYGNLQNELNVDVFDKQGQLIRQVTKVPADNSLLIWTQCR